MFHAKNAPVFNAAYSTFKSNILLFMTKSTHEKGRLHAHSLWIRCTNIFILMLWVF